MSKVDFILDDIRKSCELGEIDNIISLCEQLKTHTNIKHKEDKEFGIKHYQEVCNRDLFPDELIAVKVLCENGIYLKKGFLDPNRTTF